MFDVRELDRRVDGGLFASGRLARDLFPGIDDGLIEHVQAESPEGAILLGMFEGDRVAGIGCLLRHGVRRNGETGWAHQIRMIQTDDRSDPGLFAHCLDWTVETLRARGSAFLFGYPDTQERPAYLQSRGFSVTPLVAVDIPTPLIRHLAGLYIDQSVHCDAHAASENLISFDAYEAADRQQARHNGDVRCYEHYTNFVFGHTEVRKVLGATFRVFSVGGFEINKPPLLGALLSTIAAEEKVHIIRFVVPEDAPLGRAARFRRPIGGIDPMIAYPLNWRLDDCVLDAWIGLRDVA